MKSGFGKKLPGTDNTHKKEEKQIIFEAKEIFVCCFTKLKLLEKA